ncbi:MAG: DNA recombination protein RmuC [Candidatus Bipolaricaulota bacterium]|nr:DNA recombination protein RmuC [Candidatus Bipolaricaulota bacterium]
MTALWIAVAVLALAVGVLAWALLRRRPGPGEGALLADQVAQLSRAVTDQLGSLTAQVSQQLATTAQLLQRQDGTLGERLSEVRGVVADVREKLGQVGEIGRRTEELAREMAGLQELLRPPKARGAVGEWLLGGLLGEVLPRDRFQEQYRFKSGEAVDAAIFLEGLVVPVDAKFPLPDFQRLAAATTEDERKKHKRELIRAAQKHVDAIAGKYIRPEEGTADFALMYIPAEGVYGELLLPEGDLDFLAYALARRVIPCSPGTFYAYLRSVAMGLKGLALARNVQRLFGELRGVEDTLERMADELGTLGTHLRNARGKHEEVERLLADVRRRLERIAHEEER